MLKDGYTLMHEHIFIDLSGIKKLDDCRLDCKNETIEEFKKLYENGVRNITEVTNLEELSEKLNGKNRKNFEQVFLISESEIQNMIKNYSDIPIYFFKINDKDKFGRRTGKLKRRVDFEKQLTEIRETITEYNKTK